MVVGMPLGTVTFLFTDVEGSTRLWESHPTDMGAALALHDAIMRNTVADHRGHVFTTAGDSFAVAFARAEEAVNAAVEIQRRLADEPWPAQTPVRVRMGLHTGEAQERDGDYFGTAVTRAARVMSLATGEQVLLTAATRAIAADADLGELGFLDLGPHRLKGLTKPEVLYQLTGPGLRKDFLPISSGVALQGNLPAPIDALIGRDRDVNEVCESLLSQRLMTIVGVGGIGKTTLALEAARRIADRYPDGVWLCELAEVGSADAVPAAWVRDRHRVPAAPRPDDDAEHRRVLPATEHPARPRQLRTRTPRCRRSGRGGPVPRGWGVGVGDRVVKRSVHDVNRRTRWVRSNSVRRILRRSSCSFVGPAR